MAPTGRVGASGSAEDPFPSIQAARDALRKLKPAKRAGSVVVVAAGTYSVTDPLEFTDADDGTAEAPVVYRAKPGATVVLRGAVSVSATQWMPVVDAILLERLDPSARDAVRQVDLRAAGVPDVKSFAPTFQQGWRLLEVYAGERVLPQSRWPNGTNTTMERVIDSGSFEPNTEKGGVFVYRGERPARWARALADGGVWLRGFWRVPWVIEGIQVGAIDPAARTVTFARSIGRGIGSKYTTEVNGTRPGDGREPWHAINLIEEIDQPGEWAVDVGRQALFFWPPTADTQDIQLAADARPVVRFQGASHVVWRGFTLEQRLGNGIEVRDGEGVRIAGCTVRLMGGTGVHVRGGQRHTLVSNDLHDLGGAGLDVTGGDRRLLTPSGHEIVNNHIFRVSRDFPVGAAIVGYQTAAPHNDRANIVGARFAHNRIHDASNAGVYYGGAENLLEFNEVYRIGQDSGDLGGFYSTGGWTTFGNVVRFNFVHHCPNANAFYLDDGDSGDLVTSNVVYRADTGGFIGGGHFNHIRDNLFIACRKAGFHADARGASRNYTPTDPRLSNDLHSVAFTLPPWSERYPQLQEILRHDTTLPRGNTITGNVFIDCVLPVRLAGKPGELDGVLVERNVLEGPASDLVDEAGLKLTLRPDSATARTSPGVAAIPFDRIGLYADEDRPVVPPRAKDLQREPGTPEHGFDSTVDVEASNRKNP